ncbi:MAG: efflux RND transporter periplasmic adaptor subunit [Rhodospirillales bacterium]|nr:efflux RND transporter periplasmic adaptor subunit [Rhodospirillales bacterium]MDE2199132.1 efflux RND transporter periplasmic adaptor subunit [Rhodospirillales bacterium]MDE2573781.1 efflux RND transporter periplasmic adaptor subunit [Rhodospirillales bacterium]
MRLLAACCSALLIAALAAGPARAQFGPGGPPAVGTVVVAQRPVTETMQFVGRIQAVDKVDLVARVTAFIRERLFTEGAEVRKGDLLYRLERGPFEADLAAKQAAVAQAQALLRNATLTLNRAQSLLNTPAGQRSTVDDALASQASYAAQLLAAQAQERASQINLAYTDIRAPVAGIITRSALSVGNVVTPTSGPLASIVSQDPMYVVFPISVRSAVDLRNRYALKGGFAGVAIHVTLPDGKDYPEIGKLDYADPSVNASTDTLVMRARIPNPLRAGAVAGQPGSRELIDGEFVTVTLAGVEPVMALGIPRAAVLSDQQGDYVYVVDAQKKIEQRRVTLGQSTPAVAVIVAGLKPGEVVVADGLQRVRPGIVVNPAPIAAAKPAAR